MLFITVLLLCFFLNFSKSIIKLLHIQKIFSPKYDYSSPEFQEQLQKARAELVRLNNSPRRSDDIASTIKAMRAERKVRELEQKIRGDHEMDQLKGASAVLVINYIVKTILYVTLATLSIKNRYNPVLIFSEQFNFEPLQGLLTFPTGVPNAVSIPVWVLSCNVTFRLISGLIKQN